VPGHRRLTVGCVDGRLFGPVPFERLEEPFYDPAMGAMTPAFASAATRYLRAELQFDGEMAYRMYHMPLPAERRADVSSLRLEAGHMAYADARAHATNDRHSRPVISRPRADCRGRRSTWRR
jgi:hypothetical protein